MAQAKAERVIRATAMPKVSVIIPVYNAEKYLRECLDSVVNQTLTDMEIICINDGSTDSSPQILREYAARDSRFVIIDKENEGYGRGMNDGFDRASGEYIGIVESDDYIVPEMYEELCGICDEKNLDFVKADFVRFYDEPAGRLKIHAKLVKGGHAYDEVIDPKEDVRVFKDLINTWSGVYRRSFIEAHQIRHNTTPGASFQDNGFWFQTFAWADRILFTQKAYYMNRRDNPNSSVRQKNKIYCLNDEYHFIHDFLEAHPDLKERFIYAYSMKRARNYFWNYGRIAKECRPEYVRVISREFREAFSAGEFDRSYFTAFEWFLIRAVKTSPLIGHAVLSLRAFLSGIKAHVTKEKV